MFIQKVNLCNSAEIIYRQFYIFNPKKVTNITLVEIFPDMGEAHDEIYWRHIPYPLHMSHTIGIS